MSLCNALGARDLKRAFDIALVTLVAICATLGSLEAVAADKKPNVVFILADNVGYGDMGPYGGGELRGAPTPRIDQLAREGLRLTQYLVEPACTPSRAALMTGQYSIRNGLSLIIVPGSQNTLSARAVTMGDLFKGAGCATAIFGKRHLGKEPQSLPTAHGFDEFYGIPPDTSWDASTYVSTIELTHSIPAPPEMLLARGPQIVESVAGGPVHPSASQEIGHEWRHGTVAHVLPWSRIQPSKCERAARADRRISALGERLR